MYNTTLQELIASEEQMFQQNLRENNLQHIHNHVFMSFIQRLGTWETQL